MLRTLESFVHCKIHATDGDIGAVYSLFFDDVSWDVRYLVVETGTWLSGRKVLIAPLALGRPDWHAHTVVVRLTREQVRNSPDIDTANPVSRIQQIRLHDYYGWRLEALAWGLNLMPMVPPPPPMSKEEEEGIAMLERERDPIFAMLGSSHLMILNPQPTNSVSSRILCWMTNVGTFVF